VGVERAPAARRVRNQPQAVGTRGRGRAGKLDRERSNGSRSLDELAHAFFGIDDGSTTVVTHTFDDVVRASNAVQPYDWAAFLFGRLDSVATAAPRDDPRRGSYRLVYTDTPSVKETADDNGAK
jgi:predicted metalloprotease with PDZ domain